MTLMEFGIRQFLLSLSNGVNFLPSLAMPLLYCMKLGMQQRGQWMRHENLSVC